MGVVIKQSFWGALFAYIGVALGFFNTIVLRPAYLELDQIGLFTLVVSNALLVTPFITLGMPGTYIRYFPFLKENQELDTKFYSLQLLVIIFGCALTGIVVYFTEDYITGYFSENSPKYYQFIYVSLIILIFQTLYSQLQSYSRVHLNVIVPTALKEVYLRIGNIILILTFSAGFIDFDTMIYSLILVYGSSLAILIVYLFTKYPIKITFRVFDIPMLWIRKMIYFGGYNLLLVGSNSIYGNISFMMIPAMIGDDANGIYATCFYIGIVIEMPKRSMVQIISPILSREFKNNNLVEVNALYKRAAESLSVIATIFLLGVLVNLSDLFELIPKGGSISQGFYVVLFVAFAKLIDLTFSFNSEILIYSKYYKWNLYMFVATAALMFVLNYWWLPVWGINGAGLAFLISTTLFNFAKFLFLYWKYKFFPFTFGHLKLLVLALVLGIGAYYVPLTLPPLFNMIIRSILISILYLGMVYKLKISSDVNGIIKTISKKYLGIEF